MLWKKWVTLHTNITKFRFKIYGILTAPLHFTIEKCPLSMWYPNFCLIVIKTGAKQFGEEKCKLNKSHCGCFTILLVVVVKGYRLSLYWSGAMFSVILIWLHVSDEQTIFKSILKLIDRNICHVFILFCFILLVCLFLSFSLRQTLVWKQWFRWCWYKRRSTGSWRFICKSRYWKPSSEIYRWLHVYSPRFWHSSWKRW